MRLATLATSALLLLPCDPSDAAKRTITWDDEACSYRVEFDDKKYDETALRNTIGLVFGFPPVEAPAADSVFKPEDVEKLDLDRFQAACADALARTADLRFISLPGLDAYWAATVEKIRDKCAFETAKFRAYRDPSALRDYRPAAACSRFVDALEGKSDIRQVWRDTITESCRNNADSNQCQPQSGRRQQAERDGMDSNVRPGVRVEQLRREIPENQRGKYRRRANRVATAVQAAVDGEKGQV